MKDTKDLQETAALQPVRKGHIGLIVAGSVMTGLIVASGLAVVVFGGTAEPVITGVVLLAFGLGWGVIGLWAGLSISLTLVGIILIVVWRRRLIELTDMLSASRTAARTV